MGVIDGCERSSLACRPFYRRLAASRLLCDHHLVLKKPIIIVANNPLSYVGTDAKRDNDHHHAKPEHQQKNRFRLYQNLYRHHLPHRKSIKFAVNYPRKFHRSESLSPPPLLTEKVPISNITAAAAAMMMMIIMDENWY